MSLSILTRWWNTHSRLMDALGNEGFSFYMLGIIKTFLIFVIRKFPWYGNFVHQYTYKAY